MALRDQQLRIMERLDELSSGVLGQTSGEDRERPPVASSATIDHTASSVDMPADVIQCAALDPSTSRPSSKEGARYKYIRVGESGDSAGGAATRRAANLWFEAPCIQTPRRLDAEPDFAADFCLPSPVASSQPLRLPDGRWELGTSI